MIRRRSAMEAAELAEEARAAECAAVSELAAVYLLQTPPTDRALIGWGVFGAWDEPARAQNIVYAAARVNAADIIEQAAEYA